MKIGLALIAGAALAALTLPASAADAVVLSIAGDADCFGLGGSCGDGTLWRDDLGGAFFTSNADASDPVGTDAWETFSSPSYSLSFSGGTAPLFVEIKTAGIADNRGPYGVLLNGVSIGLITTNVGTNAFQEVRTFSFAVTAAQLLANNIVQIDTTNNNSGDGFSIDYVSLNGAVIPEPATWAMMIFGFGLAGAALRRSSGKLTAQTA